jgi:DHA2 family multidrug resistance protein
MKTRNQPIEAVSPKQWIAVIGAILGAFMAILDISITNASLQDIQGGLSATLDEGAWISTAYLVAEIVVIPMTGWLSQVFGLRRYLVWNAAIFIVASMLCGLAWSLPAMIAFRVVQGFTGGVLIPLAVNVILTQLPKSRHPLGMTLFSIAASLAPCLGPTIGGWLTVNFSWPLVFYINLVPGLLLIALVTKGLDDVPGRPELLQHGDWWGIGSLAAALGSLTVILEEGVRKDWFESDLIAGLAVLCVASLAAFLFIELRNPKPFINIRLLARRNFLFVSLASTVFGFGIYGSVFILPLFLAQIGRLDASQIGSILLWAGLPQLAVLPFMPGLVRRFDNRFLASLGMVLFGISAMMNSTLTKDWAHDQFLWSQVVRAVGQTLIITPLNSLAFGGLEGSEVGSGSGLFNMLRNLGGSVGIGTLGATLALRYHLHFTRLAEATSRFSVAAQDGLAVAAATGRRFPLGAVYKAMNRESFVMAYGDCFFLIGTLFFLGALLIFAVKPLAGPKTEVVGH